MARAGQAADASVASVVADNARVIGATIATERRLPSPNGKEGWWVVLGGDGRLLRQETPSDTTTYYEGPAGHERRVKLLCPPRDQAWFYEGARGEEHLVRMQYSSGKVMHYVGDRGKERLRRIEFPGGLVQHYEGDDQCAEHVVRVEWPSGNWGTYEGPRIASAR